MSDPEIIVGLMIMDPAWRDIDIKTDFENFIETMARSAFLSADTEWLPKSDVIDISIVLTNDDNIQEINAEYRNKDKPTNVLSFPQLSPDESDLTALEKLDFLPIGDVILARETILREADEQNKSVDAHIAHMIVHGVLHLLGYDHIDDSDAERMESLEGLILNGLGFDNPYDDQYNTRKAGC